MGCFQLITLLFMILEVLNIGYCTISSKSEDGAIFSGNDPAFFDPVDSEAEAAENEDNYEDVNNNAGAPYDKQEYLGDMMKSYFSHHMEPLPTIIPVPSDIGGGGGGGVQGVLKGGKGQMGGFGKIDISIQYGCCANINSGKIEPSEKNEVDIVPMPPPQPVMPVIETARFSNPPPAGPPGLGAGGRAYMYDDSLLSRPEEMPHTSNFRGQGYMGVIHPEDTKFDHPSTEKYIFNPRSDAHETQSKFFYRPENINTNSRHPGLNLHTENQQQKQQPPSSSLRQQSHPSSSSSSPPSPTPTPPPLHHQQLRQQQQRTNNNMNSHFSDMSKDNGNYYQQNQRNFNHNPTSTTSPPTTTIHSYTSSSRKPFTIQTTQPTTSTTSRPSYTIRDYNTNNNNNNKRYKYAMYQERTSSTTTTTPKPTQMPVKPEQGNNMYGNQRRGPMYNDPVLLTREEFYADYQPIGSDTAFYNPSTISPLGPITALSRGLPIPAERSSFYTSERLIPPYNLYGSYLQAPPLGVQPLTQMHGGRYYQGSDVERSQNSNVGPLPAQPKNVDTSSNGNAPGHGNHVTPRSILHDISKIVIQDVPKSELYSPEQQNTNIDPEQHQFSPSFLPNNFQTQQIYTPIATSEFWPDLSQQILPEMEQAIPEIITLMTTPAVTKTSTMVATTTTTTTTTSSSTPIPTIPIINEQTTVNDYQLIAKNREIFYEMQKMAYNYFKEAALMDFKQLLNKGIQEKCVELLPEEKRLLHRKTESIDQLGLDILDFLTIYERYSDILNNTELEHHILHDLDRAKEYLSMKLNKFWLELDAMDTPEEFLEKKNHYKIREKPAGLMNIFYNWYEQLICTPNKVNCEAIKTELCDVMKREKRYWLLLLRD